MPVNDATVAALKRINDRRQVRLDALLGLVAAPPSGDRSGVTDSLAVQRLIDQAASNSLSSGGLVGGTVILGRGQYWFNVLMRPRVAVYGAGWGATRCTAPKGSMAPVFGSPAGMWMPGVEVAYLTLDGNNIGGGAGRGLDFVSGAGPGDDPFGGHDPTPMFHHLFVANCFDDGIRLDGQAANGGLGAILSDFRIELCWGRGLAILGPDALVSNGTIGYNKSHCFEAYMSVYAQNVKTWYSGSYYVSDLDFSENLPFDGFYLHDNIWQSKLVGCSAQDCGRFGLHAKNVRSLSVRQFTAGDNQGGTMWLENVQDSDFEWSEQAGSRGAIAASPLITLDGAGTTRNELVARIDSRRKPTTAVSLANGALLPGNKIDLGRSRGGLQSVAFAATINPDPSEGGVVAITATGALTVGPSKGNGYSLPGQELVIAITQDGVGGRVVTWDASYVNPPAVTQTANALTVGRFVNVSTTAVPKWVRS